MKIFEETTEQPNEGTDQGDCGGDELAVFAEKRLKEPPVHRTKEMHIRPPDPSLGQPQQ